MHNHQQLIFKIDLNKITEYKYIINEYEYFNPHIPEVRAAELFS